MASPFIEIEVDDRVVKVTNPDRVYFPPSDASASGATKLDLVEYYLAVGDGIVNALFERPCMLHRFPKGLAGDKVHQKRLPAGAPEERLRPRPRARRLAGAELRCDRPPFHDHGRRSPASIGVVGSFS